MIFAPHSSPPIQHVHSSAEDIVMAEQQIFHMPAGESGWYTLARTSFSLARFGTGLGATFCGLPPVSTSEVQTQPTDAQAATEKNDAVDDPSASVAMEAKESTQRQIQMNIERLAREMKQLQESLAQSLSLGAKSESSKLEKEEVKFQAGVRRMGGNSAMCGATFRVPVGGAGAGASAGAKFGEQQHASATERRGGVSAPPSESPHFSREPCELCGGRAVGPSDKEMREVAKQVYDSPSRVGASPGRSGSLFDIQPAASTTLHANMNAGGGAKSPYEPKAGIRGCGSNLSANEKTGLSSGVAGAAHAQPTTTPFSSLFLPESSGSTPLGRSTTATTPRVKPIVAPGCGTHAMKDLDARVFLVKKGTGEPQPQGSATRPAATANDAPENAHLKNLEHLKPISESLKEIAGTLKEISAKLPREKEADAATGSERGAGWNADATN
ncbi:hypothetical protein C8T65DRAFT_150595 [Cerioporus squamosus]|nr:hypothetical protein C8T65DRAFT_150595 [Cerioporus squamosus]